MNIKKILQLTTLTLLSATLLCTSTLFAKTKLHKKIDSIKKEIKKIHTLKPAKKRFASQIKKQKKEIIRLTKKLKTAKDLSSLIDINLKIMKLAQKAVDFGEKKISPFLRANVSKTFDNKYIEIEEKNLPKEIKKIKAKGNDEKTTEIFYRLKDYVNITKKMPLTKSKVENLTNAQKDIIGGVIDIIRPDLQKKTKLTPKETKFIEEWAPKKEEKKKEKKDVEKEEEDIEEITAKEEEELSETIEELGSTEEFKEELEEKEKEKLDEQKGYIKALNALTKNIIQKTNELKKEEYKLKELKEMQTIWKSNFKRSKTILNKVTLDSLKQMLKTATDNLQNAYDLFKTEIADQIKKKTPKK
ncbi:hypothetical protein KAH94_00500 [bacterium]|nr:hypothetical protein [bacterium]